MANAVVTSDTKKIKVVFNDLSSTVGMEQGYFSKEHLVEVHESSDGYVIILLDNDSCWKISTDGSGGTILVDSVNGVSPTDTTHLCDLIAGLIDY